MGDGNNAHQTCDYHRPGATWRVPYDPARYLGVLMQFNCVTDLRVAHVTFKDPETFAFQAANLRRFTVEDVTFDYNLRRGNMDGIHRHGNCHQGRIADLKGATNDDLVALYIDQVDERDVSRERAARFAQLRIYPTIADALTGGPSDLAVDGVLLVAENPSTLLHKISEIYDRIAFAGVGKYNEFENLRVAGVRHADLKGYSYSRGDVTGKALANAYSQALGNIFTQDIKPFEVEVLVVEVAEANGAKNEIFHILYDGTIEDEHNYAAMGGQADEIRRVLKDNYGEGLSLQEALQLGVRALMVTQNKALTERDLEVAVLDRAKERRRFRRIPPEALSQLLEGSK